MRGAGPEIAFVGSGDRVSSAAEGSAARQGSEGRDESEVAEERGAESAEGVEADEWTCNRDRMLLLLADEAAVESARERVEAAELLAERRGWLAWVVGRQGEGEGEAEERKRNMTVEVALCSCDASRNAD